MSQTQKLKHHTPLHTQVKIMSMLQKLTHAYLQTLLLKLMICQVHVRIQTINMIQIQLHLQKKIILPVESTNINKMKLCHVAVEERTTNPNPNSSDSHGFYTSATYVKFTSGTRRSIFFLFFVSVIHFFLPLQGCRKNQVSCHSSLKSSNTKVHPEHLTN